MDCTCGRVPILIKQIQRIRGDQMSWIGLLGLLRERGPFNVGHIQIVHTYQPLSDQPERTIPIEIWYPTEDTTGTPATYFMGIDESCFADATPAAPVYERGYPVHLSSHGYQGWGANSAFLMSHFASHGWVVVAPNHIDNTLVDHASPLPIRHFIHRPKDLTESLNVLETLDWELSDSYRVCSLEWSLFWSLVLHLGWRWEQRTTMLKRCVQKVLD